MKDKFDIITHYVNNNTTDELSIIDELSLIDNFFENLIHSNERIIHSDLILQILWFRKEIDSSEIILRHLENYLKEKKISIRNNIKKGTFEIGTGLNSLIKNYIDKINTCSIFVSDNQKIMSNGLSQLYYKIITDPSLLSFLKLEISSLDESNVNSIKKLTYIMKKISEVNSNIKSYEWFLFLIASSIRTIIEENNNKSYPVPENYQQIINFRENLSLYQKVETVYSYLGNDIHIILNSIINILFGTFIKIMKTCSILELYYIINNYKKIFQTIFAHNNILIQNKKIKDTFTNQFFIFIERIEKAKEIAKSRITGKQPQKNIIISIGSRQIQIPANLSLSNQKKNLIQMTDNIIAQLTGKEEKYIQINETTKKDQGITISVGSKQILIPFKLSNKEKREKIAQLANKITLQKFSNTTELESFGNTPILEPYWNKPILDPSWNKPQPQPQSQPQPQPEVVQNTEAINNNKLPMGIYSSNSVSMYASIRY